MKRILVLDNDPAILDVMQEILSYEGFDVKTLEDTDNIFTCIDNYQPDLVLIDYILNGINGGELCAQIKKNPLTSGLPVIIMSAYSKVLLSLGNYGCDEFIAKPFDLAHFVNRICLYTSTNNALTA
ncbi:response regulator [Mucilaginibacter sp. PAMB04274]|uniref:response regulator transcription factor n=1 Tax=Mucilaginibacter sp. PAMB04274 TaxID=3138568 RepID=UPI0031F64E1C